MKKLFAILLALTMLLALASCGGEQPAGNQAADQKKTEEATPAPTAEEPASTEEEAPKAEAVNLGDTISLDFVEMTLDAFEVSPGYEFSSNKGSVTYKSKVDCPSGMKLICLKGKITSKAKESVVTGNNPVFGVLTVNGYEYKMKLSCFNLEDAKPELSIEPMMPTDYFFYAEVPEALATAIESVRLDFGFVEGMETPASARVDTVEDLDYRYALEVMPTAI